MPVHDAEAEPAQTAYVADEIPCPQCKTRLTPHCGGECVWMNCLKCRVTYGPSNNFEIKTKKKAGG